MEETRIPVGRVLRVDTRSFTAGCRVMQPEIPAFGSFVRADVDPPGDAIYGLIYDVAIQDDLFVRRVVLAEPEEETILDLRENRLVPIEVGVLAVGYRQQGQIVQRIPPQPPVTLNTIYPCPPDEVVDFTRRFDFFRLVLDAPGLPADELLAAALCAAAVARSPSEREPFLIDAGRELARMLPGDLLRLDGLLRRLRPA